jgi:FKBP-type peptidyl-prolyl cis-trans isomerase FklB
MKKLLSITASLFVTSVLLSFFSCTAQTPKASLKTANDSLSYAYGISSTQGIDQYLAQQGIDSVSMKYFLEGLSEGAKVSEDEFKKINARLMGIQIGNNVGKNVENMSRRLLGNDSTLNLDRNNFLAGFIDGAANKKLLIEASVAQAYVDSVSSEIRTKSLEKEHGAAKVENLNFLEDNKSKEGVITLPSGLQYKVKKEGKGLKPTATDKVKVDYVGTLIDGTVFDSSVKEGGKPAEFFLNQVIPGWTEGIQLMPVGSEYTFYIPYELAYGADGRPGSIPSFATLIFEVTLHDIVTPK